MVRDPRSPHLPPAPDDTDLDNEAWAAAELKLATNLARSILTDLRRAELSPASSMLSCMLSSALLAKALGMPQDVFLSGCSAAFRSVEVTEHGLQ